MITDALGGFLPLELSKGKAYHSGKYCVSLNTARNCLEYLLLVGNYDKIYLPHFLCEVILEPILRQNVKYEFYHIDEILEPIFDFNVLREKDAFLYINYFGIKDLYVNGLAKSVDNLIVDNAQAFFFIPTQDINTFYSARKFFGVADGAFLYTRQKHDDVFETDLSFKRMEHLLRRIDQYAESAYNSFQANERELSNQPIRRMSKLTTAILDSVEYESHKGKRMANFWHYHKRLRDRNLLKIGNFDFVGPLSYPLRLKDHRIKQKLHNNRVFTPTYWPNVLKEMSPSSVEYQLAMEIVHLPLDQRYSTRDLDYILNLIE